ncbi:MAG: hypothetical protein QGG73_07765 [Candidatus Hydrogenedentes bacterium]|nr:hypothetical protein [Candidatus Hydrogenedentota bacterium]
MIRAFPVSTLAVVGSGFSAGPPAAAQRNVHSLSGKLRHGDTGAVLFDNILSCAVARADGFTPRQ